MKAEYAFAGQGMTGTVESLSDLKELRYVDEYHIGPIQAGGGFDGQQAWEKDPSGTVDVKAGGDSRQLAVRAKPAGWTLARRCAERCLIFRWKGESDPCSGQRKSLHQSGEVFGDDQFARLGAQRDSRCADQPPDEGRALTGRQVETHDSSRGARQKVS